LSETLGEALHPRGGSRSGLRDNEWMLVAMTSCRGGSHGETYGCRSGFTWRYFVGRGPAMVWATTARSATDLPTLGNVVRRKHGAARAGYPRAGSMGPPRPGRGPIIQASGRKRRGVSAGRRPWAAREGEKQGWALAPRADVCGGGCEPRQVGLFHSRPVVLGCGVVSAARAAPCAALSLDDFKVALGGRSATGAPATGFWFV